MIKVIKPKSLVVLTLFVIINVTAIILLLKETYTMWAMCLILIGLVLVGGLEKQGEKRFVIDERKKIFIKNIKF